MRARRVAAATTVITLVLGATAAGVAFADDGPVPSKQDVRDAQAAVQAQADSVAEVRARLVAANQRLEQSAVAAAQAAETFNGARWRAEQARIAAEKARASATAAQADVDRQRDAYSEAVVRSYELAPGLTALSAVVHADGIDAVIQRSATMQNASDALDGNYDEFRAAAVVADVARRRAEDAQGDAERAEREARDAQRAAQQAEADAAADAQSIAAEKTTLIARLAELQHVSVDLAQQRQSALEARAARLAAAAARREQQAAARTSPAPTQSPAPTRTAEPAPEAQSTPEPDPESESRPESEPESEQAPTTHQQKPAAPSPKSGAQAAIAFARAQLGEPYRWGAAGPSAWDCSGLTSGAWAAGGISLPHYSVAQYEQSTPISPSQLQPGDLVFWGSSSSPSSIYHVAMYVGGGKIIHAPRTGKPVTEESMYYWITPNFYARP